MDIQQLTQKMNDFVSAKGWYGPETSRPQTLRNLAVSLSLEASEVLEHFQWNDRLEDPQAFADELADVTLYLLQLAHVAGIDLEDAVLQKLARNYTRQWERSNRE